MVHYFVNTINYVPNDSSSCINCKQNNLIRNREIALTGNTKENLSPKESKLCLYCETLMVITNEKENMMSLTLRDPTDSVTLRHSGGKK